MRRGEIVAAYTDDSEIAVEFGNDRSCGLEAGIVVWGGSAVAAYSPAVT